MINQDGRYVSQLPLEDHRDGHRPCEGSCLLIPLVIIQDLVAGYASPEGIVV